MASTNTIIDVIAELSVDILEADVACNKNELKLIPTFISCTDSRKKDEKVQMKFELKDVHKHAGKEFQQVPQEV
ncbi:hypothetical protein LIER_24954 [Lithospermum erythrorhizon]|uniref:Uncharacterized protein n=1 Tax=Lithospermum erythrorhizon TaxID=34254 RepID=A0AAV3R706_LITER